MKKLSHRQKNRQEPKPKKGFQPVKQFTSALQGNESIQRQNERISAQLGIYCPSLFCTKCHLSFVKLSFPFMKYCVLYSLLTTCSVFAIVKTRQYARQNVLC